MQKKTIFKNSLSLKYGYTTLLGNCYSRLPRTDEIVKTITRRDFYVIEKFNDFAKKEKNKFKVSDRQPL